MIHTREQLFKEIQKIISSHVHGECWECIDKSAEEICDLIATLNDEDPEATWKNIP